MYTLELTDEELEELLSTLTSQIAVLKNNNLTNPILKQYQDYRLKIVTKIRDRLIGISNGTT